jgi:hypothetical protein
MTQTEIGRIKRDLALIQGAMGLKLSFGGEMLVFGALLASAAGRAAVLSLLSQSDWFQVGPCAAIMMLCVLWLYRRSRVIDSLSHEIKLQVCLSITVYAAVIGAALGYSLAAVLSPALGSARTVGLYAASIAYVLGFLTILILNSLKSRERYYCLGLAAALLLAGLLIPITDHRYSFFLAHCFIAIGALIGVAIQWVQLRKAAVHDAAD